jgi:hypothetical protein
MSARVPVICLGLLVVFLAGFARGQFSVDSTIQRVDSLYTSGAFSRAELEARRLLENDMLSDSVRTLAEQWVAFALVAQERPDLGKEHFTAILRRHPSYELDPILTSPKILKVYNEAKATFRTQPQGGPSQGSPEVNPSAEITYRTILFPGWEQLYHGRTTVGAVFLGAGIVTLGSGIALEFKRSAARSEYLAATTPEDIESRYETYNRTRKAEMWAFAAFAAVYIASEVEVLTHGPSLSLSLRPADPRGQGPGVLLSLSLR